MGHFPSSAQLITKQSVTGTLRLPVREIMNLAALEQYGRIFFINDNQASLPACNLNFNMSAGY